MWLPLILASVRQERALDDMAFLLRYKLVGAPVEATRPPLELRGSRATITLQPVLRRHHSVMTLASVLPQVQLCEF